MFTQENVKKLKEKYNANYPRVFEAGSLSVYRTGAYTEEHYNVDIVELFVGFFDVEKGGC